MKYLAVVFSLSVLAACMPMKDRHSEPQTGSTTKVPTPDKSKNMQDAVVEFLLSAAANDFHVNRPPNPIRFRNVRMGHVINKSGEAQHMLCGQFLIAKENGEEEWLEFATIKTSGYEQWVGSQAASFCASSSVVWDQVGDLSSALKSKLDGIQ